MNFLVNLIDPANFNVLFLGVSALIISVAKIFFTSKNSIVALKYIYGVAGLGVAALGYVIGASTVLEAAVGYLIIGGCYFEIAEKLVTLNKEKI